MVDFNLKFLEDPRLDFSTDTLDVAAMRREIDQASQTAVEHAFNEETRANAIALKAAIEQYGLTPSLMVFANHDGSLTQITGLADAAALETLSDQERDEQTGSLLSALEAYIDKNTPSTENFGVALIGAGLLLGAVKLVEKISDSSKVYGNAHQIGYLTTLMKQCIEIASKTASLSRTGSSKDDAKIKQALLGISGDLAKIGFHIDQDARLVREEKHIFVLQQEKFKTSGITPQVYQSLVSTISETEHAIREISGAVSEHAKTHNENSAHVRTVTDAEHYALAVAIHCYASLQHTAKSASKFFKK